MFVSKVPWGYQEFSHFSFLSVQLCTLYRLITGMYPKGKCSKQTSWNLLNELPFYSGSWYPKFELPRNSLMITDFFHILSRFSSYQSKQNYPDFTNHNFWYCFCFKRLSLVRVYDFEGKKYKHADSFCKTNLPGIPLLPWCYTLHVHRVITLSLSSRVPSPVAYPASSHMTGTVCEVLSQTHAQDSARNGGKGDSCSQATAEGNKTNPVAISHSDSLHVKGPYCCTGAKGMSRQGHRDRSKHFQFFIVHYILVTKTPWRRDECDLYISWGLLALWISGYNQPRLQTILQPMVSVNF